MKSMVINTPLKNITQVTACRTVRYSADNVEGIWGDVFRQDIEDIKKLYLTMEKIVCDKITTFAFNSLAELLYRVAYKNHGKYIKESDYMAVISGVLSPAQMAFLQRQYTLAHAALCTTTTVWDEEKKEMLCMRSMDWQGAEDIANCTRIFNFVDRCGKHIATVAGIAGMIGVLTGVKKGFSIAGNYAHWPTSATFRSDPTFLIRELLQNETIDTYEAAVETVGSWDVGAPCFITICGVKKGDASVVEFGARNKKYYRKADQNGFLVQTNHYSCEEFKKHNREYYQQEPEEGWYNTDLLKNSEKRQRQIIDGLNAFSPQKTTCEEHLKNIFRMPPVMNHETAQWVLMRPTDGSLRESAMKIWACTSV